MTGRPNLVALSVLTMLLLPFVPNAGSPVTTMSPFYPPTYGAPQQQAPYWANPYWATPGTLSFTPGTTYYPQGSPNLPAQYANPVLNGFPPGAQTCSAPPYTCPTSARTRLDAYSCRLRTAQQLTALSADADEGGPAS